MRVKEIKPCFGSPGLHTLTVIDGGDVQKYRHIRLGMADLKAISDYYLEHKGKDSNDRHSS